MLFPGVTGFGVAELDTARSAVPAAPTVVEAVAELFPELGSGVDEEMLAVAEITVPEAVPALTVRTMGKVAVPPFAKVALVQVKVPVPPTAMVLQDQPEGGTSKTPNVVPVGIVSVKTLVDAAIGP